MGFSRQEYWSGLPFPSPGDLPDPEIEPRSPALQADALPSEPPGKSKSEGKCGKSIQRYVSALNTVVYMLSGAPLFGALWTLDHQAPLSMGFPRHSWRPEMGVGCRFLLQGIFQTQGWTLSLLHLLPWQADSLPLSHLGSPLTLLGNVISG